MKNVAVVVPNWNGKDRLGACLDSLLAQTRKHRLIVVDNGSADGSAAYVRERYPSAHLIINKTNLGFAGGVNSGIKAALEQDCNYIALFNNDAVAEPDWLECLAGALDADDMLGIAASKLVSSDKSHLDSTGECYTSWGLPYPRGRGESDIDKYDEQTDIFAASGGASLYRVSMLEEIGLFDERFFAYYEDVDLSFRAQLAGWKVAYVPVAVAYHEIGGTSGKIRGFTTYQTLKNLPMVLVKNMPRRYLWRVSWRLLLAEILFFGRAVLRGHGWSALKGKAMCVWYAPGTLRQRRRIQKTRKVSDKYIWNMLVHDLPPNARALRKLRGKG